MVPTGRTWTLLGAALAAGFACGACGKSEKKQASVSRSATARAPAPDPAKEAKSYFAENCVVCHGADGKGDGAGAIALRPKPRDFTDPKWQTSVQDDYLKTVIVQGGAAIKPKPQMAMPSHPDLGDKPRVVDQLVKIVRGFQQG